MESLLNPHVLQIDPYRPGKPVEEIQREFGLARIVKLASNENMLPIPVNVRKAVAEELSQAHYYPDSDSHRLRQRIAEYNGIGMESVIVGAGSVEIIHMLIRAFLKPGERVLTSEKTFSLYKIATTEIAGAAAFVEAPMDPEFRFDLDAIAGRIDERNKIIFITNPNNPTGTFLHADAVRSFIDRVPGDRIIVLDNAYQEYIDDPDDYVTGLSEIAAGRNVVVLRTFSKIYGLAGLRIGYAMARPEIIAILNRVKPPFNVTRLGQCAALASLENEDFKNESLRLNRAAKPRLFAQLQELGLRVIPSQANFLLFFPGIGVDVAELNRRLLEQGVIVRPAAGFGIPEAMRVTIGLPQDNDFFVAKLKQVLEDMKR
ncbi:MAG: histidinol-phosphate transaminase [Candidatus Aminicenantes bacterium]|nr:histidinol-phosphate transaminase [Candidatus Aminicenantes bacterium]